MTQLEIMGNDGKPVLYASLENGDLRLEFEYYSRIPGEADLEVIYSIKPDDFAAIKSIFACEPEMDILSALAAISQAGKGEELRNKVRSGEITSESFSWMSFDD